MRSGAETSDGSGLARSQREKPRIFVQFPGAPGCLSSQLVSAVAMAAANAVTNLRNDIEETKAYFLQLLQIIDDAEGTENSVQPHCCTS